MNDSSSSSGLTFLRKKGLALSGKAPVKLGFALQRLRQTSKPLLKKKKKTENSPLSKKSTGLKDIGHLISRYFITYTMSYTADYIAIE